MRIEAWTRMAARVRRGRRAALTLVAGAGLVAVLAACGGGASTSSGGSSAGKGASFTVHGTDFTYTSGLPQSASAGKVHFVLQNDSKTYQHEMWIYPQQQPKLQDMINQEQSSGNMVDQTQFLQNAAGAAPADAGKSSAFDVQLSPGTYEVACFVVSNIGGKNQVHYSLGMHNTLTVK